MRFTPKSLLCSALLLVTGFTCYFVGKRSVRYPKPTALDCAFYKAQEFVTPESGATVVLGQPNSCDPTWDKDGKPVCAQVAPINPPSKKKQGWVYYDDDMPEQTQPYKPSVKEKQ